MTIIINDEIVIKQLLTKIKFYKGKTLLTTEVNFDKNIQEKSKPYLIGERLYCFSDAKIIVE